MNSCVDFLEPALKEFVPHLSVQRRLYCGYKALVVWLQDACTAATRPLYSRYQALVLWRQMCLHVAISYAPRKKQMRRCSKTIVFLKHFCLAIVPKHTEQHIIHARAKPLVHTFCK